MGWAIGYDNNWRRDIGYGVPATCDHPDCNNEIDRGLDYVCGGEPYGGEHGCGLFFCPEHKVGYHQRCERCNNRHDSFTAKPDRPEWIRHKLEDESWQEWRDANPEKVKEMRQQLEQGG